MSNQNPAFVLNLDNLDVIFLLDKSGSMGDPYKSGDPRSRWQVAEETVSALAKEMAEHDDDGITVVPFNDGFTVIDNVTGDKVGEIFKQHRPGSSTYLAGPLSAVINKFLPAQKETKQVTKKGFLGFGGGSANEETGNYVRVTPKKPVCIVVATDGAASDKDAVIATIVDATKRITARTSLGILFIQVGSDPNAEQFMEELDSELGPAGAEFDIVARCKLEDVEDHSTQELLTLAYTA